MTMHQRLLYVAPEADIVVKAQSIMRHFGCQLQIMRHHHDGHTQLTVDIPEHSVQFDLRIRIDSGSRLVQSSSSGCRTIARAKRHAAADRLITHLFYDAQALEDKTVPASFPLWLCQPGKFSETYCCHTKGPAR